jgi:uncharacterized membrane protein YuzA (DUF378 family)
MDLQTIITYIIVGLAAGFVIRTFIRQFSSRDAGCSACTHCSPETSHEASQATELIQVETPDK